MTRKQFAIFVFIGRPRRTVNKGSGAEKKKRLDGRTQRTRLNTVSSRELMKKCAAGYIKSQPLKRANDTTIRKRGKNAENLNRNGPLRKQPNVQRRRKRPRPSNRRKLLLSAIKEKKKKKRKQKEVALMDKKLFLHCATTAKKEEMGRRGRTS